MPCAYGHPTPKFWFVARGVHFLNVRARAALHGSSCHLSPTRGDTARRRLPALVIDSPWPIRQAIVRGLSPVATEYRTKRARRSLSVHRSRSIRVPWRVAFTRVVKLAVDARQWPASRSAAFDDGSTASFHPCGAARQRNDENFLRWRNSTGPILVFPDVHLYEHVARTVRRFSLMIVICTVALP